MFDWSYEEFRSNLLEEFNKEERLSVLQTRWFLQIQDKERVAPFIAGKVAIARRLKLPMDSRQLTQRISKLLRADIKLHLLGRKIDTTEELLEAAKEIETGLLEVERRPTQVGGSGELARNNPVICRICRGEHYFRNCPERRRAEAPRGQLALPSTDPQQNTRNVERGPARQE